MADLFLLTGPVHSGKTTALLNWSKKGNDVSGILTPVIGGKRFFMDAATNEIFEMETKEVEVLEIGKYRFSKKSFNKAINIISSAKEGKGWLVVDEIGPLELKDQGFSEIVRAVIPVLGKESKAIFVIRDSILQEVIKHFQLEEIGYKVITIDSELFQ